MDGTPGYSTFAFDSKDLDNVNNYSVASALVFNVVSSSKSYASKGSKRKCSAVDQHINLEDGSSLVLGLGPLSSSCATICSAKEIEEESSIDLGLNININIPNTRPFKPIDISAGTLNALEARRPILDLQLSLSTGPTESDVTTATQVVIPYQNNPASPAFALPLQLVDEGSTSSRWKTGPLLTPLQNLDIPDPLIPKFSSSALIAPSLVVSPGVGTRQQRKISVKPCKFEGCTRGARGASGLCIAHGGGRRCQRASCQNGAEGKTVFCKAHGGGRRCQELGCTKSAEGRTDYCIGHGGGRRCSHEGCARASRGKSGLCIRHGGGKRCQMEYCTKSAEDIAGLCISHGGGRRCLYLECTKGAQGSTMFCKAHGGGRRCTSLGCMKGAEGSTLFCKAHGGGKRCTSEGCTKSVHGGTLFCVSHGGGKRCAVPECTKSARGRTNYCVRHGGGKRCKFEGCTKSAQGSTDFCKAHGGGKRCSWGQCDKFARGKSDLCAAHSAQVTTQDSESSLSTQTRGNYKAGSLLSYPVPTNETSSFCSIGNRGPLISLPMAPRENFMMGNASMDHLSLPEGRVHGGRLMAMLKGGATSGTNNSNQGGSAQSESYHVPHSWV